MATDNTVQYTITAKDQASAVFAQVATKAKGASAGIAESLATIGAAAFAMRGTVKDGMAVLSGDFTKLGSLLGSLPGPIGVVGQAVGDTMGRILDSTIKAADGYRRLSEKTGASIEFLSRFTEAADDVFISSESVSSALNIFAKKIGGIEDAMDGSGVSAGAFAAKLREIGVTSDNMEEALLQVADRFKEMPNGTDKAALAVQLFGKQGAELIPILNKGRDGIKQMGDAAEALGLTMDTKTSAAVQRLKERQDAFNDTIKGTETRLGKELIPMFLDWSEAQQQANRETSGMLGPLRDLKALYLQLNSANYQAAQALKTTTNNVKEFGEWALKAEAPARDLTHTTVDMGIAFENLDGPTRTANQLFKETSDAARIATMEEYNNKRAAEELSAQQQALADATNNVNSAFNATPKAMDAAEKAMALFDVATGKTTLAQIGQRQAMEAIRDALDKGIISYPDAAKALIGLRDGTLSTEDAFKRAGAAAKPYVAELNDIKEKADLIKPKEVAITMRNRWDDYGDLKGKYDSFQNKTVTVTINSNAGSGIDREPNLPGDYSGGGGSSGGGGYSGGAGSATYIPPSPYGNGNNYENGGMTIAGGGRGTPGKQDAAQFNVNNPAIIIRSINGAAIAQQIARDNANVARRARARAAIQG